MAVSKPVQVRLSEEIDAALRAWCAENDVEISEVMRDGALHLIGRPDLAGTMRGRGQPRKTRVSQNLPF